MTFLPAWVVLPAAFLLDLCVGDPRFLPHPIRWMGKAIEDLEPPFRKLPLPAAVSGVIFTAALVLSTWATTELLLLAAQTLHPVVKISMEIVLIYYCISAQSLQDAAMDVKPYLKIWLTA
jgi:adenosylcobinamide-phosphate synthase